MVQCVHSLEGRARFKVKGLRGSGPLKSFLEQRLPEHPAITRASACALTGNVLISFRRQEGLAKIAALVESDFLEFCRTTPTMPAKDVRPAQDGENRASGRGLFGSVKDWLLNGKHVPGFRRRQESKPWHEMDAGSVLDFQGSSREAGLSPAAAREKMQKHGRNTLPAPLPRSGPWLLLEQISAMPIASVGLAAGISLLTGGIGDAVAAVAVVLINSGIGYVTEQQAEETIGAVATSDDAPVQVVRSGELQEIAAADVMLGDILMLQPGTYVPADARIIEENRLTVNESELTGESLPVRKKVEPLGRQRVPLAERANMVYRGTLVTGGSGLAVVVATGTSTELGELQDLFGEVLPPQPAIARHLNRVGRQAVFMGAAACGAVLFTALLRGVSLAGLVQTSFSLIAAAIPEGLATLAVSALALNIRDMKRNHIFVRRLRAVGNLGSIQTVCFDKTGTLTLNRMTILKLHTAVGAVEVMDDRLYLNGVPVDPLSLPELLWLMRVTVLCNETEISREQDEITLAGSATESVLVRLALRCGVDVAALRSEYPLLGIRYRSAEHPFMTTVHRRRGGAELVAVKGNPLDVLARCSWQLQAGEKVPMGEQERHFIELQNEVMAGAALRVLGVAYAEPEEVSLQGRDDEEKDLIWLGLVGMADPLRKGARELIAALHQAGIDTKIITGDQSTTAHAIGRQLNLSGDKPLEIFDSSQIEALDPDVLPSLVQRAHIFARVSHTQKVHILQAYQNTGKVVAMAGDGINDAPALKVADVGVSLGLSGTDLAREAADIILEDDDLARILTVVRDGRGIFDNIKKSVRFLLTTNASEILTKLAATAAGLGLPADGIQSICTNLLCLALSLEPPRSELLRRSPPATDEPLMGAADIGKMARESVIMAAGAAGTGAYGAARYGIGPKAGAMAFQSLALGQILYALICRSNSAGNTDDGQATSNPYLRAALFGSLAVQLLATLAPSLRSILGLAPIGITDAMVVGAGALLPFWINRGNTGTATGAPAVQTD